MTIPKEVKNILTKLEKAGFEAYIVGGCVRDLLRDTEPKDWDVATSAKPEEIRKIFPKSFYENKFLTVTVQTVSKAPKLKEIEVTTFRSEAKYSDKRHPDKVKFAKSIQEDLARRDFTVNSMALEAKSKVQSSLGFRQRRKGWCGQSKISPKFQILNSKQLKLIDPFNGQEDLKNKIIRAVGKPEERFSEDALRMMRAVRFATTLDFTIEPETFKAIRNNAGLLEFISKERVRDEFLKIIMAEKAMQGIEVLRETKLLKYIVSELLEGYGVEQNKHHIYTVWEHNLRALAFAAKKNFNADVRIASLFHDIAKPRVKIGVGSDSTFYSHEIVGAKITAQVLSRLKFPRKQIEKIVKLVRFHLFYYNVDEVGESSVRKLVRRVGPEYMDELLQVRQADRIGSGVPKAEPYKLRHLKYLVEKVSTDPISAKMLKINGNELMKLLGIEPGPKVGIILDILLGQVLEDPKRNKKAHLKAEANKLGQLKEEELKKLSDEARKKREDIGMKQDQMTKEKYWVT